MEIKKNLKIVEGDCFAYKIEENIKFKGRYLILIATELNDINSKGYNVFFRCKITEDCIIPKTEIEIDKLEYIIFDVIPMEMRFFPLDGNRSDEEVIAERSKVKVYPDENGYLYTYTFDMTISKRSQLNKFIYLGNFSIIKPTNDFIPFKLVNLPCNAVHYFEYKTILKYESYNLKQSKMWKDVKNTREKAKLLLNTVISVSKDKN